MYENIKKRVSLLLQSDFEKALSSSRIGLEKESLRVSPEGNLSQLTHPAALGSPLTHSQITTDFSEALTELITPPFESVEDAIQSLDDIQNFIYHNLDDEILWATSMPCVVEGETKIPLARYGTSNAAQMKTAYRRGLGLRYGRVMQVIAGVHFNYSFSPEFWALYQSLSNNSDDPQEFISEHYMGLVRNLLRYGWLVAYLFGASPAVCKSFLQGKRTSLEEFDSNTYYEPYATSLRLGDIGYTNSKEKDSGIKANYDSLESYANSLLGAISTPYPGYEKFGIKVDGKYQQLNANILQIENEYYASVRPKQILQGDEMPSLALKKRGIAYVELRSLDVNAFDPHGINAEQLHFLEILMLFCLLQESPPLSSTEIAAIDDNMLQVAHKGRQPGLLLKRGEQALSLQDWAAELCHQMKPIANLLDSANYCEKYFTSLRSQIAAVFDPDLTPSARMLAEMRQREEGFYHYAKRMSQHYYHYYNDKPLPADKLEFFRQMALDSDTKKNQIEAGDDISLDQYLANYFGQNTD